MTTDDATPVEIAVRGWSRITRTKNRRRNGAPSRATTAEPRQRESAPEDRRFRHALVLDTETRTDAGQALMFGFCQHCIYAPDGELVPVEEVCFHADELPDADPRGYAHLQEYVRTHPAHVRSAPGYRASRRTAIIALVSRTEFVRDYLLPLAAEAGACVIGFNLPFDLPRLAIGASTGNGGGFSLAFDGDANAPRIVVQKAGPKKAFIRWVESGQRTRGPNRGRFVDVATLAFALTDRGGSLDSAYRAFVGDDGGKTHPVEHGIITPEYIGYGRNDVSVTRLAAQEVLREFYRHESLNLHPADALSPASIAKAQRRAFGMTPILDRFPDFPDEVLGYAMSAFYGGRTEVTIRRTPVPTGYFDYTSMYPAVNALMRVQDFHVREKIEVVEDADTLAEYQAMLDTLTLDKCLDRSMWPRFFALGLVEPDGDVLPLRARYGENSSRQIALSRIVAGNELTGQTRLWYVMPDLIASKILTGKPPKLLRVLRFVATGDLLPTLRPVKLRGEIEIDPRRDDVSVALIERRKEIDAGTAEGARIGRFLKVLANSGEYGIFGEMNAEDGKRSEIVVHNHTGKSWTETVNAPEKPGPMCFPPIAACITSAARLMLALLERLTADAGGTSCLRDTDSSAIVLVTPEMQARLDGAPAGATFRDLPGVERTEDGLYLVACPGGPHRLSDGREAVRALTVADMDAIRARLNRLNPYDSTVIPQLLKLEASGWTYAVSSKRYTMFSYDKWGRPYLVAQRDGKLLRLTYSARAKNVRALPAAAGNEAHKYSEAILGAYEPPFGTGKEWIPEAWLRILLRESGHQVEAPPWYSYAVFTRYPVSSPHVMRTFDRWNEGLSYAEQVKPFNFLTVGHLSRLPGTAPSAADVRPITPFKRTPGPAAETGWLNLYDRKGGRLAVVNSESKAGGLILKVSDNEDSVSLKNYYQVLSEHRLGTEAKFLGANGLPCDITTKGLLTRMTVRGYVTRTIGKEGNSLDERDALMRGASVVTQLEYQDPWASDFFATHVMRVLRGCPAGDLYDHPTIRLSSASPSQSHLRSILNGQRMAGPQLRSLLTTVACQLVVGELRLTGKARTKALQNPVATILSYKGQPNGYQEVSIPSGTRLGRARRWITGSDT